MKSRCYYVEQYVKNEGWLTIDNYETLAEARRGFAACQKDEYYKTRQLRLVKKIVKVYATHAPEEN